MIPYSGIPNVFMMCLGHLRRIEATNTFLNDTSGYINPLTCKVVRTHTVVKAIGVRAGGSQLKVATLSNPHDIV
jgi:hypothetical protein